MSDKNKLEVFNEYKEAKNKFEEEEEIAKGKIIPFLYRSLNSNFIAAQKSLTEKKKQYDETFPPGISELENEIKKLKKNLETIQNSFLFIYGVYALFGYDPTKAISDKITTNNTDLNVKNASLTSIIPLTNKKNPSWLDQLNEYKDIKTNYALSNIQEVTSIMKKTLIRQEQDETKIEQNKAQIAQAYIEFLKSRHTPDDWEKVEEVKKKFKSSFDNSTFLNTLNKTLITNKLAIPKANQTNQSCSTSTIESSLRNNSTSSNIMVPDEANFQERVFDMQDNIRNFKSWLKIDKNDDAYKVWSTNHTNCSKLTNFTNINKIYTNLISFNEHLNNPTFMTKLTYGDPKETDKNILNALIKYLDEFTAQPNQKSWDEITNTILNKDTKISDYTKDFYLKIKEQFAPKPQQGRNDEIFLDKINMKLFRRKFKPDFLAHEKKDIELLDKLRQYYTTGKENKIWNEVNEISSNESNVFSESVNELMNDIATIENPQTDLKLK